MGDGRRGQTTGFLAARSIYLRVAELLRANHTPLDAKKLAHSPIALRLRTGVIESEYFLQMRCAYMASYASIHAHPQSKIEDAFRQVNALYNEVRSAIPYITGGKSGQDMEQDERMAFAKEFEAHRMKERTDFKERHKQKSKDQLVVKKLGSDD